MNYDNDNQQNQPNRGNRRQLPAPSPYSGLGKLPPQATDVEEAVLGALMLEKDALIQVADILKPEVFYRDNHQKIYAAIRVLFEQTKPVDILTVTAQLRTQGELEMIGGAYYITELTNRVASAANIEYHCRIIIQKFIQRELIRVSTEVINSAYDDTTDVLDLLDTANSQLSDLQQGSVPGMESTLEDALMERLVQYEEMTKLEITGLPSGFQDLDKKTGGFQDTDLIIIGGRPAMGKTALGLTIARNIAINSTLNNKPIKVGFFSLEMSKGQLTDRLLSMESLVELWKLRAPKVMQDWEWQTIHKKAGAMSAKNSIVIDDFSTMTINQFKAKARRMKAKHGIQVIIVDYLQLMKGSASKGNRDQELGEITRGLKAVAKSLKIPIIALAQLSRSVEQRAGGAKRPMLSDLRESGSIEQDADMVLFIHRPEYYGIEVDEDNNSTLGMAEIIVAKYRHGETGITKVRWIGKYTTFADLDADWAQPALDLPTPNFKSFIIKPSNRFTPGDDDDKDDDPPF